MVTETVYIDSSAIVKWVVREPGWQALETYLRDIPARAVSRVATVEVPRAIARVPGLDVAAMAERLRSVFERLTLLEFGAEVAAAAARLQPATLRSLDAIHLASALELRDDLVALVTYDARMMDAAKHLGLPTAAPT
jgi:predicted nucleic acid-binding protein